MRWAAHEEKKTEDGWHDKVSTLPSNLPFAGKNSNLTTTRGWNCKSQGLTQRFPESYTEPCDKGISDKFRSVIVEVDMSFPGIDIIPDRLESTIVRGMPPVEDIPPELKGFITAVDLSVFEKKATGKRKRTSLASIGFTEIDASGEAVHASGH